MTQLQYITDTMPGFTRKKRGKYFSYFNVQGEKITDKQVIARINSLSIR